MSFRAEPTWPSRSPPSSDERARNSLDGFCAKRLSPVVTASLHFPSRSNGSEKDFRAAVGSVAPELPWRVRKFLSFPVMCTGLHGHCGEPDRLSTTARSNIFLFRDFRQKRQWETAAIHCMD